MEHNLIVGAELHDPAELAALNPDLTPKQLARLRMLAQVLDEDDAATGHLEPGEDDDYHAPDLGTCPYYAHIRHGAPFGTCTFGCWDEPRCQTDEPEEGWASAPVAAVDSTGKEQQQ